MSIMLNLIIQTIPKVDANKYEEGRPVVKSRSKWKNDFINNLIIFIFCIVAVVLTDKVPIPYIGTFFFIGGIFGMIYTALFGFRAFLIYKHYFDIYKEEDLKKLEE